MSSESGPIAIPAPPLRTSNLAPPTRPSRPQSADSIKTGSSRRGRSTNSSHKSSNLSRNNSHSSRGTSDGADQTKKTGPTMKKSGATTTISGGICLGPKDGADNVGKTKDNVGKIKDKGKTGKGESRERADSSGQGKGLNRRSSVQANRRPNPIVIARPSSQNSNRISKHAEDAPLSSSAPRNITAPVSAPRTAMEAAVDAATQKHNAMSGGDALSSLQKMISDLKAISPSSAVSAPSSWGSASGSRSASANKEAPAQVTPATGGITSPVPIPRAGKKLKADAPSFTPSFQPSSLSPAATQPSVSPGTANAPPWPAQPRSASHGSVRRASSSSNGQGSLPSFITMPDTAASCDSGYVNPNSHLSLATVNAYQSHLHVHPEAENEDLSPMYSQHVDAQYQHNQVLAAQQLQYQQIQLLQAQLATAQLSQQQQQQQQQQMGNFMAPRFQALAAQRAAQQQQQQLQQLAHAQQLYELQQQQLLEAQRHQEESARAAAQTVLSNPPAVFEDDSPETKTVSLGPTGRPQLAPSFTFGAKPRSESDRDSMSPPQQAPVINRSEGIGGAAATGLAGLAARAHRRTGSEMSPAMQQQVGDVPQAVLTSQLELQKEIEALQAKQKALMQEDLATSSSGLNQLNARAKQTPSQTIARHRRVQSSLPSATPADPFTGVTTADSPEPRQVIRGFGEMPPPPVPAGHSRRHSVNVLNKPAGTGRGFGMSQDIPEDGLPDGGGHHRSGSRSSMDMGSWRVQNSGAISDLAAAQAQLQSLAQFRAAAGGGHSKMASFSFPNMLPNLLAATTLSTPVGQSLWQQQHAFQMQLQQTSQGPQRKSLFAPYLPQASLPPLLNAGKLVVGVLRVNKKNRSDAYVATDVLEADIYICGSKDRNRALEGDIVAVELLDVDEVWNTKKDKEEKKRKKEETAAYDFKPAQVKKLEKKKDDVEVEGQGLTLFEDEEVNDETKPTYAGHVVAVVERMPGQLFSGQIGVLRPSSAATKEKQEFERREREGDRAKKDEPEARPKIVWFKPTDKRVPLIAIPTEQAPTDFIDDPDAYIDRLFVATIKRWPITSLHPFGTLVEELGPIGDCEVETSALLKDCNFPSEEFQDMTLKCLPPLPWSIPDREYEIRNDLRGERVFTIDPHTTKDLDDALSIKANDDGTYTVGVHIADVSYFLKSNTAMDRDARKRATSVYLVQRAVPMLPPQLSEQLCSLQPDVDRLTFSASFVLDNEANVLEKDFSRSIIKSCAKLAYADAQAVLENQSLQAGRVSAAHPVAEVEGDIRTLHDLAKNLRGKRVKAGAMMSSKIKVAFRLNEEGKPTDCEPYSRLEANILVEEFMLLANTAVARAIAFGLPEQSLLRRHEPPIERRIDGFVTRAHKLGFEFEGTTAAALQKGFDNMPDPETALCLELLKKKAMQRARYFCSGMLDIAKYSHWSLAIPLYTHFTSPIRRYADVLVHRMLDACITSPNPSYVKFHMDRDQVAKCAQQCNMKKQSAKLAEDQSVHLYLCMLIHDLTERYGPVIREGRVTGVLDAAFDVVVPEFGIEKRVHIDKMPVENTVFDEHRDILSLYWTTQDVLAFLAETSDDPHLLKIKELGEPHANGTTEANDADGDSNGEGAVGSKQYQKSARRVRPKFDGLRTTPSGHKIQDVKELMPIPVIITSDVTKSPPVLVVYACNPYAA